MTFLQFYELLYLITEICTRKNYQKMVEDSVNPPCNGFHSKPLMYGKYTNKLPQTATTRHIGSKYHRNCWL